MFSSCFRLILVLPSSYSHLAFVFLSSSLALLSSFFRLILALLSSSLALLSSCFRLILALLSSSLVLLSFCTCLVFLSPCSRFPLVLLSSCSGLILVLLSSSLPLLSSCFCLALVLLSFYSRLAFVLLSCEICLTFVLFSPYSRRALVLRFVLVSSCFRFVSSCFRLTLVLLSSIVLVLLSSCSRVKFRLVLALLSSSRTFALFSPRFFFLASLYCNCKRVEIILFFQKSSYLVHILGVDGCALQNLKCDQGCIWTRLGYRCVCYDGYRLHRNKSTCIGNQSLSYYYLSCSIQLSFYTIPH